MRHPSNMVLSPRQKLRLAAQRGWVRREDVTPELVVDLGFELGLGVAHTRDLLPETARVIGVDLFQPYIDRAPPGYTEFRGCDAEYFARVCLPNINGYEFADEEHPQDPTLVYCCELLEHMPKELGYCLLSAIETYANWAFVSTPRGFCEQEELDDNPLQRHLSGWTAGDFERRGWKIRVDSDTHNLVCAVWRRS